MTLASNCFGPRAGSLTSSGSRKFLPIQWVTRACVDILRLIKSESRGKRLYNWRDESSVVPISVFNSGIDTRQVSILRPRFRLLPERASHQYLICSWPCARPQTTLERAARFQQAVNSVLISKRFGDFVMRVEYHRIILGAKCTRAGPRYVKALRCSGNSLARSLLMPVVGSHYERSELVLS